MNQRTAWTPPAEVSRKEALRISVEVLGATGVPITETEDIFRITCLGLEWDMGVLVFEPKDAKDVARGPDGKKIGVFVLHGGSGDFKAMAPLARIYAGKFGHKVVCMTFPGRLYFDDPSRDWPGDTIKQDGTVRTPMWLRGEHITPDQYDVVSDTSKRMRYGTRTVARAKPGTNFYYRMAAWPAAFDDGMREAMRRHLPDGEYSIYGTGHSTGGPHIFMMSQRVPNMAGVIAVEHSPFGVIQAKQHDWSGALGKIAGFERVSKKPDPRSDPFNELYIRTWRDLARYRGPEALGQEGPAALMRLPWLMEEILDAWEVAKKRPQFKAEYIITHNVQASLKAGAEATADRLKLSPQEREALVARFCSYPHPLPGKPIPPILFTITKDSRDHSLDVYREVVLPEFSKLPMAPKTALIHLGAGVHTYWKPEEGLPVGAAPIAAYLNHQAITSGYFLS
jgi:hypothetical protein